MESKIKKITRLAIIAGLYAILTIVFSFISYGQIQIRISEILILLCFFKSDYIISLVLGCFIANLNSPFGIIDSLVGSLATFLSCICIILSKKLITKDKIKLGLAISCIYPILLNGIIVGLMISYISEVPIFITMLEVAIGELISMVIAYALFITLLKRNILNVLFNIEKNDSKNNDKNDFKKI